MRRLWMTLALAIPVVGCAPQGSGLARTPDGSGARVRFDINHRPLPDLPLPNDFATRYDPTSLTGRRLNISLEANTLWERAAREDVDRLDGWGTYQAISVSFEKPLDLHNILRRHVGDDYSPEDDVAYLVDVTPDSPDFCSRVPLDMGEGNFPVVLEEPGYFTNDRGGDNFVFEDREEDTNRNGRLDPGEDLDMDGVLDHPNVLTPGASTFSAMSFYERETNTLLLRPVLPLRETTTYAVVLTRRLVDEDGRPIRSPFDFVNHAEQTQELRPLVSCLPRLGLGLEDVAFTWSYTTQSITADFRAIRDGLYGVGPMAYLADEFGSDLELLPVRDVDRWPRDTNTRIVPQAAFAPVIADLVRAISGSTTISPSTQAVIDSHKFVDFYAAFTVKSPQFFPRTDSEGQMLPVYRQTWDLNPSTGAAFTRPEKLTVFITVPKRRTGPAPALIVGHGYTGSKIDPLFYGGFFARFGIATVGVEAVSHGVGLERSTTELVYSALNGKGLGAMARALTDSHRAIDWDGNGIADSGADYWTAHMGHTRDVVRQSVVDYMQLIRVLRTFDGSRTWRYGPTVGSRHLAGDFDDDGVVDVGGPIHFGGASLGGILSGMMGGLEPQLETSIPVAGAAGLGDVAIRSIQNGVRQAVSLRVLAPLMIGVRNAQGRLELRQLVPNLTREEEVPLSAVGGDPKAGDTVVLWNLGTEAKRRTGWWKREYRCGRVEGDGLFRVAVPSDEGDQLSLAVYPGALPPQEHEGCRIPPGAIPSWTAETLDRPVTWWGTSFPAGSPITALGDGLGFRRQTPGLRAFTGFAQAVIERGDPVNVLPFAERHRVLRYGTGEEVSTRMLIIPTLGDMNVPIAAGVAMGRAAGFVELFDEDPRYGRTVNRVLIDHGVLEGVERTGRYRDSRGRPVLIDVARLPDIAAVSDGFDMPRLDPPLRPVQSTPRLGGKSGMLIVTPSATGDHGFAPPDPSSPFDIGTFLLNALGRYVETGGTEFPLAPCNLRSTCPWIPPPPP